MPPIPPGPVAAEEGSEDNDGQHKGNAAPLFRRPTQPPEIVVEPEVEPESKPEVEAEVPAVMIPTVVIPAEDSQSKDDVVQSITGSNILI